MAIIEEDEKNEILKTLSFISKEDNEIDTKLITKVK